MNSNKIIGYILLVVGLVIIGATLYYSYNIFTAKVSAPLVFKMQTPSKTVSNGSPADAQKQLEQVIQKQLGELLPLDTIPKVLNLLSWSIVAGILIFGGAQIAGLGVRMII